MGEIVIKIPRHKSHVKIIRSEKVFEREIKEHKFRDLSYNKARIEQEEAKRQQEELSRARTPVKPVFIEKFTFSDTNQPIQIPLSNINREMINLEDAKLEIQFAYDKGFTDGQEASNAAYTKELNDHRNWVKSIASLVNELKSQFSNELYAMERVSISLATVIAKHIVERELSNDANLVFELVRKAIKSIDEESLFKIAVNPDDYKILEHFRLDLLNDKALASKIEISPDADVDAGGCILHTDAGIVDARVDTQLLKIKELMDEEYSKHEEPEELEDYLENEEDEES
jgi:flagellar assembly protein FliH